jgi:hypothetical protein
MYSVFRSRCGCFVTYCTSTNERARHERLANDATALSGSSQCFQEPNLAPGQIDGH